METLYATQIQKIQKLIAELRWYKQGGASRDHPPEPGPYAPQEPGKTSRNPWGPNTAEFENHWPLA